MASTFRGHSSAVEILAEVMDWVSQVTLSDIRNS